MGPAGRGMCRKDKQSLIRKGLDTPTGKNQEYKKSRQRKYTERRLKWKEVLLLWLLFLCNICISRNCGHESKACDHRHIQAQNHNKSKYQLHQIHLSSHILLGFPRQTFHAQWPNWEFGNLRNKKRSFSGFLYSCIITHVSLL